MVNNYAARWRSSNIAFPRNNSGRDVTNSIVRQPREDKMATLLPPVRVSPLIRFGRWSFLLTGVLWGIHRQRKNSKTEAAWQEYDAKQKVIRDAKHAEEKARLNREELIYLAKETGTPIPAGF